MKISVIIPAYNEEKYLRKTLEAILAQDYPDFEVIVVDNGSTDKTAEIAKSFPKVKVLFEGNKGTMWACERGRKSATGEIVVRTDADCLPEKDWLSKGAAFFANPKVVAVSGPYKYYDSSASFSWLSLCIQKYLFVPFNVLMQTFHLRVAITIGGNTFLRARSLEQIGGFDTSIVFYGDDTDIAKRMSSIGKVIFSSNVIMSTSARRYKKQGIFRLNAKYTFYFFKTILFGKS